MGIVGVEVAGVDLVVAVVGLLRLEVELGWDPAGGQSEPERFLVGLRSDLGRRCDSEESERSSESRWRKPLRDWNRLKSRESAEHCCGLIRFG